MKTIRALPAVLSLCCLVVTHAVPAYAITTWELGLRGIGIQDIDIRNCSTGQTTRYRSHDGYSHNCFSNFLVSFDTRNDGADAELQPGISYIFTFLSWGKSARIIGQSGIDSGNDDVYAFTNNSSPPTLQSCFSAGTQSVTDWPSATCSAPPPPPPPSISLTLVVESSVPVGTDKTRYSLKATASGGNGSYQFSWLNVTTVTTGVTQNPSLANRLLFNSQTATVTATVQSGSGTVSKSIQIGLQSP